MRRAGTSPVRWLWLVVLLASACTCTRARPGTDRVVIIASKKFTESVILGDVMTGLLRGRGVAARHRREIGGTRVLWSALRRGDIDAYVEYTGTIAREILGSRVDARDRAGVRQALRAQGVTTGPDLGFNNTYVLGMRAARARDLGVRTISDLRRLPALRLGLTAEFMNRADGWPGLQRAYGLPQRNVRGMDHDLSYRGLAAGDLDVVDLYATDAEIAYYKLRTLKDDRGFFPEYRAVILISRNCPSKARSVLAQLRGRIGNTAMVQMNREVKVNRRGAGSVARDFLSKTYGDLRPERLGLGGNRGVLSRVLQRTAEHLAMVTIALVAGLLTALPLGIVAYRRPRLGQLLLGLSGLVQTVPALALLVLLIPMFGIGWVPAIVALYVYSLLPILRNTHAGLSDVAPAYRDSGRALGLNDGQLLRYVELPLAARSILAGIKTSAVISVGTATLGALVGAGGYGQPILSGIRLDDVGLILEGALPAAGLALAVQGVFEFIERRSVSRGLGVG